jgi:hypothetical protein
LKIKLIKIAGNRETEPSYVALLKEIQPRRKNERIYDYNGVDVTGNHLEAVLLAFLVKCTEFKDLECDCQPLWIIAR